VNTASNALFAILVVVFVLGTYTLALSLESIIDQWTALRKQKWGAKTSKENSGIQSEDRESITSVYGLGNSFGLKNRRKVRGISKSEDMEAGVSKVS
jgi:hypothetical protein